MHDTFSIEFTSSNKGMSAYGDRFCDSIIVLENDVFFIIFNNRTKIFSIIVFNSHVAVSDTLYSIFARYYHKDEEVILFNSREVTYRSNSIHATGIMFDFRSQLLLTHISLNSLIDKDKTKIRLYLTKEPLFTRLNINIKKAVAYFRKKLL